MRCGKERAELESEFAIEREEVEKKQAILLDLPSTMHY